MRIHCGIGRFCFCFFARVTLVLNRFCDGILRARGARRCDKRAGGVPGQTDAGASGYAELAKRSARSRRARPRSSSRYLLQHCNRKRTSFALAAISLRSVSGRTSASACTP
jgi:hypothetical protein